MIDRLMPVEGERAPWDADLPVEVDGGAEREYAGGDSRPEPVWCFGEVVFEPKLVFEGVDDRLDPLADEADRWLRAVGVVGAAWADDEAAEFAHGLLELVSGEALVADDELAGDRLAGEQVESRLALGRVRGDEVEVTNAAVRAADEDELHAPVEAGVGGRVADAAPGRELATVGCLHALAAGQRGRVDEADRVVEAGQLTGDRAPECDQLGRKRTAALVVARLARQFGEEVAEPPTSDRQEAAVARLPEQHLRHHQAEQLVVGDRLRPAASRPRIGRKERAGSAIDCDRHGVEVGAHVGLLVDGAFTTPTFDTLVSGPYPVITAPTVNYRSTI